MQPSPHDCTVHHCVVDRYVVNNVGMGQLQPMGEQWPKNNISVSAVMSADFTADYFYDIFFRKKRPCLQRNNFAVPQIFSEDARLKQEAGNWSVIVEKQNRVIHDHREPFWVNWNFSKFLDAYIRQPIYLISADIPKILDTSFPKYLECDLLRRHVIDTRIWMSGGNTSSSLHFDTHDVVIQQIDGVKEIFLWHPDIGNASYQDFHTRYGLSPINVDRVDKIRFPEFAKHQPLFTVLFPGDTLYLPTLWWHQFRAPMGRNIMKTYEIDHRLNIAPKHTATKTEAHKHAWQSIMSQTPHRCDALPKNSNSTKRRTPSPIHTSVASLGCHTFCASSCAELNGDYAGECGRCGPEYACNPSVWQH